MSEPKEHFPALGGLLAGHLEESSSQSWSFQEVSPDGEPSDFMIKNNDNGSTLDIQHTEAVATRGDELVQLKGFESGNMECPPLHLQSSELRVEESVGHKMRAYPKEIRGDLVLLVDFGTIGWGDNEVDAMQEACRRMNPDFKAIYAVHAGSGRCVRLDA